MKEQTNNQGKGKIDQEIEQIVLWGFIFVIAILFMLPVLIGVLIHFALCALKKEQFSIYVGIAGVIILIIEGVTGNLLSYLAIFAEFNIPFVSKTIKDLLQPVGISINTFLTLIALSMVFNFGFGLFVKVFWKKKIVSKQEKIHKIKSSHKYKSFRENRKEFLEKEQQEYRQSDLKEVFVGYTEFKERVIIPEREFNYHMLAVGGTGTGKTTLIAAVMEGALRSNKPIIFVDGKGERKSMLEFKQFCEAYGKKVYMFSENDNYTYNPIKYGTPTEIRDKIMNLFEWSEPFYKNFSSRYLQLVVLLIDAAGLERDIQTVFELLSVSNVQEVIKNCYEEEEMEEEIEVELEKDSFDKKTVNDDDPFASIDDEESEKMIVKEKRIEKRTVQRLPLDLLHIARSFQDFYDEDSEKNLTGLRNQLGELLESDLGYLFRNSENEIDLRKITDEGNVVIFSISGNRYRDYIKKLGKIIILDVNSLVAYRQETGSKKTLAIYDEFSAYGNGEIVDIVNKSRSAGFECIISTQTIADLDAVEPFLTSRILSNCNILAAGRVNDSDDAEKLAKQFSTFQDLEVTTQIENKNNVIKVQAEKGTVRDVEAFIAHPREIKSLQIGEIFLYRKMVEEGVGKNYTRECMSEMP